MLLYESNPPFEAVARPMAFDQCRECTLGASRGKFSLLTLAMRWSDVLVTS